MQGLLDIKRKSLDLKRKSLEKEVPKLALDEAFREGE